jgi:hypothetical protein
MGDSNAPWHESCGSSAVTFRKEKTMKRVAVALVLLAAGSARAEIPVDVPSDSMGVESSVTNASAIYAVDEDRDGRTDRLLVLEHSDSLV